MSELEIFDAAVGKIEPAERSAFLDQACAGDPAMRHRIDLLLRAHDSVGRVLESPAIVPLNAVPSASGEATVALDRSTDARDADAVRVTADEPAITALQAPDEEDDALAFLEPSGKPGALGRLGHYEVLEVLGKGAFGVVVRAFDERLHRVVAIKIMAPQLASTSPARKRFLREACSAAAVRHENVIAIHAVEERPIPYLVMEYIAGETLQQKLDRTGPIDAEEVLLIGRQIASGLAAAHAMGLIHRDIKPANILLEKSALLRIKITDFGLARATDDASLTQSGYIVGTPTYMAPEQAKGELIDQRADLFSLGSVLYVMCSGRRPFRASTTLAVLKRVAEDTPRSIREIIPEVPQKLCDVISKLHAKKPEDRFGSATEVADLLGRYLLEWQVSGSLKEQGRAQTAANAPSVATAPLAPGVSSTNQSAARHMPRRLWLATAVLASLVIVGLGLTEAIGITQFSRGLGRWLASEGPPIVKVGGEKVPPAPPALAVAPFAADQARAHQEAWAKHLGMSVEIANSVGMKLMLIPPGKFTMGSPDAEKDARPQDGPCHEVTLTRPFLAGAHEVTQAQYHKVIGHNPSDFAFTGKAEAKVVGIDTDAFPVENVNWDDAVEFCRRLSELPEEKRASRVYRLPTEAEWEFSCRAGTQGNFHIGDFLQATDANFTATQMQRPVPVGTYPGNAFGLFDMHGNVFEWCQDWTSDRYPSGPVLDPKGAATGTLRAARGGNYGYLDIYCRSAARDRFAPTIRRGGIGFRVVCEIGP
jgi:serine/threonine protein kinase